MCLYKNIGDGALFIIKKFAALIALLGFSLLLAACSREADSNVLRLAHNMTTDHPVHIAMVDMGERLEVLSGGEMSIQIYSGGQLGKEREVIELLQIGAIAMTKVSTISMSGFSEDMRVFSVPYIFENNAHYWRVLNGPVGQDILGSLEPALLKGLGFYDAGSRSFYMTDGPIRTPADLKGKKIRVQPSRASIDMVKALGGSATPISWGELYTALQQGVVDGAENNSPSYYISKHYETAKYYSLDEHTSVPDLIIISAKVWQGLSAQEQGWLSEAMAQSSLKQREQWAKASKDALEKVAKAGVEIIYPDKKPFQDAVKGLKASHDGSRIGDLLERIAAEAQTEAPSP
ncbi:MAG: TRAP transporter substrate-binding protein [Robiginitomaculum sp.]